MRTARPLIALLVVTALLGGTAFAQQSRNQGRNRQRPNQPSRAQYGGSFSFQVRTLPAEYSLLLTRTIFARSHRSAEPPQRNFARDNNGPPRRSNEIIFRGAMREGTRFLAGIENTNSRHTLWLSEGDAMANNGIRVKQIALDHLIVEQRGVRRIVQIGESVEAGEQLAGPTTLPAVANVSRPLTD